MKSTRRGVEHKILVGQTVDDRETDHDLRFADGMFHIERAREFHRLDCRRIEDGVSRTFLHGYLSQLPVRSNDGFQDDFSFLTV